jgi:hypothetical protein
MSSRRY